MGNFVNWGSVRGVAQPGSALAWGARGRKFKSCHPDEHKNGSQVSWGPFFLVHYYHPTINPQYTGIPIVMLKGKVTAKAIGRYNDGFACGTAIFMAAGTAM